jgi:hypothetical protein
VLQQSRASPTPSTSDNDSSDDSDSSVFDPPLKSKYGGPTKPVTVSHSNPSAGVAPYVGMTFYAVDNKHAMEMAKAHLRAFEKSSVGSTLMIMSKGRHADFASAAQSSKHVTLVCECDTKNLLVTGVSAPGKCTKRVELRANKSKSECRVVCIEGEHIDCISNKSLRRHDLDVLPNVAQLLSNSTNSANMVKSSALKAAAHASGVSPTKSQISRKRKDIRLSIEQVKVDSYKRADWTLRRLVTLNPLMRGFVQYQAPQINKTTEEDTEDDDTFIGDAPVVTRSYYVDTNSGLLVVTGPEPLSGCQVVGIGCTHPLLAKLVEKKLVCKALHMDFAALKDDASKQKVFIANLQLAGKNFTAATAVQPGESLDTWRTCVSLLDDVIGFAGDWVSFTDRPVGVRRMLWRDHLLFPMPSYPHLERNVRKQVPNANMEVLQGLVFANDESTFQVRSKEAKQSHGPLWSYLERSEADEGIFEDTELQAEPALRHLWSRSSRKPLSESVARLADDGAGGLHFGYPERDSSNTAEQQHNTDKVTGARYLSPVQLMIEKLKQGSNVAAKLCHKLKDSKSALIEPAAKHHIAIKQAAVDISVCRDLGQGQHEVRVPMSNEVYIVDLRKRTCSVPGCIHLSSSDLPCKHYLKVSLHVEKLAPDDFIIKHYPKYTRVAPLVEFLDSDEAKVNFIDLDEMPNEELQDVAPPPLKRHKAHLKSANKRIPSSGEAKRELKSSLAKEKKMIKAAAKKPKVAKRPKALAKKDSA